MLRTARDTRGFTLAELLIAVAIVVVLAAMAIPAVISVQRNMHFVEMENAAAQIAQAAQNQMTSKKTSGTWLALLDEKTSSYSIQQAKYVPGGSQATSGIYYMSASQARANGILPRNAIEDKVRDGDFVIEYDRATASIVGVLYSDGKNSMFDRSPTAGTPAEDYYKNKGSLDRDVRLNHKPAIGYYEGTPAGATNTVSLEKPVIWVSEIGELCVQNPNLLNTDSSAGWARNSVTKIRLTKMDADGNETQISFGLDGLQSSLGIFEIFIDGEAPVTVTQADSSSFIELASRAGGEPLDTFVIKLEALLTFLKARGDEYSDIANQFSSEDNILVYAKVSTSDRPCVPTTAKAYMKFPTLVARLNIYVTDPAYLEANPSAVNPKYTVPSSVVKLKAGGDPVNGTKMTALDPMVHTIPISQRSWPDQREGYQAYSGSYINFSDADEMMWVETTVGSYSPSSSTTHQYQVFELWINSVKVGYLHENEWEWVYPALADCIIGLDQSSASYSPPTLYIDPLEFEATVESLGIASNPTNGYDLYVRTTPQLSEVDTYWKSWVGSQAGNISPATYTARSNDSTSSGISAAFLSEFGAPSSVASWTVSKGTESSVTGYPDNSNDIRIYYAGAAAVGFLDQAVQGTQLKSTAYIAQNTALWLYKYENSSYNKKPRAMMRTPRNIDPVDPYWTVASTSYAEPDFALSHMNDELFYRVLFYFEDKDYSVSIPGIEPQYIPYSAQADSNISSFVVMPNPSGGLFQGWDTYSTSPSWGTGVFRCQKDAYMGQVVNGFLYYDTYLAFGRIDLAEKRYNPDITDTLGVVYYEYYSDGTFGVYGYVDTITPLSSLTNKEITSWGYWLLGDSSRGNNSNPSMTISGGNKINLGGKSSSITINGIQYKAYDLVTPIKNNSLISTWGSTVTCRFSWNQGDSTGEYSLNIHFAQMVNNEFSTPGESLTWGQDGGTPWKVRHISQFPGSLDSQLYAPYGYNNDNYQQTHSIDFKGQTAKPAYGNGVTFMGSYDGNGFYIKNFARLASNSNNIDKGLFATLVGTKSKPVVLKNIVLDYSELGSTALSTTVGGSSPFSFGLLSSKATYAKLDHCFVLGAVGEGAAARPLEIIVDAGYGALNMGGLLGTAENCTITECGVYDIVLASKTARASGMPLRAGSLIGYVSGSDTRITWNNQKPLNYASNVVLKTPAGGTLMMGGLVGANASNVSNVAWSDLVLSFYDVSSSIGGTTSTITSTSGGVA